MSKKALNILKDDFFCVEIKNSLEVFPSIELLNKSIQLKMGKEASGKNDLHQKLTYLSLIQDYKEIFIDSINQVIYVGAKYEIFVNFSKLSIFVQLDFLFF